MAELDTHEPELFELRVQARKAGLHRSACTPKAQGPHPKRVARLTSPVLDGAGDLNSLNPLNPLLSI